jgi:putative transposase
LSEAKGSAGGKTACEKFAGWNIPYYRRWTKEGGCFFLTVVTYRRRPIFSSKSARILLRQSMDKICAERPWETEAIVLMPDHWHALWRLPEGDTDYSTRISRVKKIFTDAWLSRHGREAETTPAQHRSRRRGVWQAKFMEHTIRDARDFKLHLDYIHLNPVKHGMVKYPRDWPWSSFQKWVAAGEYEADWLGRIDLMSNVEYFTFDG